MTPFELGESAKHLLADPVFNRCMADLRAELVDRLEQVPIGDMDTQHEVALMLQLLKRIRSTLEGYTEAITVDKHQQRHESFIERTRERFSDLMPRRVR